MIDADYVMAVHDFVLSTQPGLHGMSGVGTIESVLARVDNLKMYQEVDDVFAIAAMYAVSIAKGHVFNDGNKRTALTCALGYLHLQGFEVQENSLLADMMELVAEGELGVDDVANVFALLSARSD